LWSGKAAEDRQERERKRIEKSLGEGNIFLVRSKGKGKGEDGTTLVVVEKKGKR
jgi:hypothetical protein